MCLRCGLVGFSEGVQGAGGCGDGICWIFATERKKAFGESGEVPLGDGRLIGERVSAVGVDVTEGLFWVVLVEKSAGSEVEGFAGDGHVVGVHDAVDEADAHPVCDEQGLAGADGFEECEIAVGALVLSAEGVVPFDYVICEGGEGVGVSARGKVFKGTDADVAFCDAGEDGSG